MFKLKITSSTVTGWPSCQRASGRSSKATQERSSGISIVFASSPYSVKASSLDCVVRVSNVSPTPDAAVPRTM